MNPREILQQKRAEVLEIAEKYGVKNLRIFGSVARGEDLPDSDIDFLAEFPPGFTLFDHAAFIRELETILGIKADVISERGLRQRIRERVMKEAIQI